LISPPDYVLNALFTKHGLNTSFLLLSLELKTIYGYDQERDLVLFINKEILVDNKAVKPSKWVQKGVISMKDLLKNDGSYLSFRRISDKFACKTNFLQYYQIISSTDIPNQLLLKATQVNKVHTTQRILYKQRSLFNFKSNLGINLLTTAH